MRKNQHILFIISLLVLLLFQFFSTFSFKTDDFLTVTFLNVGQGDSILIEVPNGVQTLIDAGSGQKVLQELAKEINPFDRSIDLVIATHPDLDHIGGFPEVLKRFSVGSFLTSSSTKETETSEAIEELIQVEFINNGDRIILDSERNIYIDVLFPYDEYTTSDANDRSLVMRLTYGEIEFLFTGDASEKIEEYLVQNFKKYLPADVLKAGHHGSKTSTREDFVSAVSPKYVVISAGQDNKYGHPHKEVLDTLEKFDLDILYTKNGPVSFKTNGKTLSY